MSRSLCFRLLVLSSPITTLVSKVELLVASKHYTTDSQCACSSMFVPAGTLGW